MDASSAISTVVAVGSLVYAALAHRYAVLGWKLRQQEKEEAMRLQRAHTANDVVSHAIENALNTLTELEQLIWAIRNGEGLLNPTETAELRQAKLSSRVAVQEHALITTGVLAAPVELNTYLDKLLMVPFPVDKPATMSDYELGLEAAKQALAARDLKDAIDRVRQSIGAYQPLARLN